MIKTTKTNIPTTKNNHGYINEGISTKKTAIIIVTVVGCLAILWPKIFYPMIFGGGSSSKTNTNLLDQKLHGGCCDVVLDREKFYNLTPSNIGPQLYRKRLHLFTDELSIRQERPSHLHPESIYQSMRERGRAIPATATVPIIEKAKSASNPPPRIIEGRPGPIPGMRPPMGAGSFHQAQPKGSSMGFIMPLYTIGIVVFFIYTILKIAFKKPVQNEPYGPAPVDSNFRKEVFGHESKINGDNSSETKLVVAAIQSLIDAADEQLNKREFKTTSDFTKNQYQNTKRTNENTTNGQTPLITDSNKESSILDKEQLVEENKENEKEQQGNNDRSIEVLGMEVTASCEGGQKWFGRPPTPVFGSRSGNSTEQEELMPEPQSIFLEGSLAHESQILVADSETKTEEIYDKELNGSPEEPAVVLSSKMTLSLININSNSTQNPEYENKNDIESPLADDIEIIGHDEEN